MTRASYIETDLGVQQAPTSVPLKIHPLPSQQANIIKTVAPAVKIKPAAEAKAGLENQTAILASDGDAGA